MDGGTGGIDRPIQVAPAPFHSYMGLIDPPRFVARFEIPPHPLLKLGSVALNPSPHRRVISAIRRSISNSQCYGARGNIEDTNEPRKE
jgi:hypothetical protein